MLPLFDGRLICRVVAPFCEFTADESCSNSGGCVCGCGRMSRGIEFVPLHCRVSVLGPSMPSATCWKAGL